MSELIDVDVYFGEASNEKTEWRNQRTIDDSDDRPLKETPEEVIKILGFDPLEFNEE